MQNKLLVAASALVLTMAVATSASARDGFYMAVRGGIADQNVKDDKGSFTDELLVDIDKVGMFSGALGYKWNWFRLEAEYVWRNKYDDTVRPNAFTTYDTSLENSSYMVNAYVDFMPDYLFSPYISAGIGYSDMKLKYEEPGRRNQEWSHNNFTWSVGAGMTLRFNTCLNLDAGYRYTDLGSLEKSKFKSHEFYGGLRYTF